MLRRTVRKLTWQRINCSPLRCSVSRRAESVMGDRSSCAVPDILQPPRLFPGVPAQHFLCAVRRWYSPVDHAAISSHSDFAPQTKEPSSIDSQDIDNKIKKLVSTRRVVLFMKGTPEQPQCGFSARVVSLMKECGVRDRYTYVNVLAYPVIREGVKKISNWPTIPQLFIDGEFVGGCDIISDLYAKGELKSMLTAPEDASHSTPSTE